MSDHILGVFWAAFLLFSWTAASIVSGATIERIRTGAGKVMITIIGDKKETLVGVGTMFYLTF